MNGLAERNLRQMVAIRFDNAGNTRISPRGLRIVHQYDGLPVARHLNHPGQQTMGKQLPVSRAGQRLPLKPVTHAVTLRADLPRRAPERLFRGFIKLMVFRSW
ncbi:Uncharacterised protein [Enterobacter cloacae]|nr:Uncharacterised protein [Enterobacter cloacae]